jgi:hypothetical protein
MSARPGALIYGTITVGALLAAESAQRETYTETVAAVLLALFLYWVAHSYAGFAAHRLRQGEPLELTGLLRSMVSELPILLGGAIPLLALVIFWVAGAGLGSAVDAGIWTSAGTIMAIEVISGIRAGERGHDLLLQSVLGALLGFLVIALRLVLH